MTRITCSTCVFLLALALAAPAQAAPILHWDGETLEQRDDPALPPPSLSDPPAPAGPCEQQQPLRASATSVNQAIDRARSRKQVTTDQAADYKRIYREAKSTRARLSGSYRNELSSVISTLERIAAADRLTGSRMPALFLQLDRNDEFWGGDPKFPAREDVPEEPCRRAQTGRAGSRIQFYGSEIVYQYYPGNGLQIQPLANFGKANGIYTACRRKEERCDEAALRKLLDELVAIRSSRGGFTTWEYWFAFSGGAPPWVSGMAQGTALQALTRGSVLLKEPSYMRVAKTALGLFEKSTPTGVRARGEGGGAHYALYSFAPGLRVLNGFLQTITGIYDYARTAKDDRAMRIFRAGDRSARREVPRYDTGAWSLYSQGGAESDLNYHNVVTDFLENLCSRTKTGVYCQKADRFNAYKKAAPRVSYKGPSRARRGRRTALAFTLNKVSCVTATIKDASGRQVYRSQIKFFRGRRSFTWAPRDAGTYTLEIDTLDLRKNRTVITRTITVRSG
ncbi:MAG: D-glucuronyl C5-epimerase family protein [Actinomycetota bacterium]|nr:D-glucuronyl C5-epimerase family protein [Actinomycetota bacterium]